MLQKAPIVALLSLLTASAAWSQCEFQTISCNQTKVSQLTADDCMLSGGQFADLWRFDGVSGIPVTVTMSSTDFDALLYLLSPDGVTPVDNSSDDNGGGGTNSRIDHVLTSTGTWTIAATTITPSATGTYMLGLTCAAVVCVPDAETLCLNNGRFKVQATFLTSQGQSGEAEAVGLTSDTGYFWFFAASNVEIVVKVLNGCGLGGHYWVFAGGLTNVNTVITVTDMQSGKFKTYTNSQGKAFAPIEDTGAFPTCP